MAGAIKHGGCPGGIASKEYKAFSHIKQRIKNPDSYAFGLELRFESYSEFIKDIGPCPNELYSVDRKDNDKGYIPGNVRWASRIVQNNNRCNVIEVDTPNGKMSLKAACRAFNKDYMKTYHLFKRGSLIDWS